MPTYQEQNFVIDGSNGLLHMRVDGKPSIRAFCALLAMLDREGCFFRVWFDRSITHHIEKAGVDVNELSALMDELNRHGLLSIAPRADIGIQADCRRFGAGVINGGDRNDSWPAPVPAIFRVRLNAAPGGELLVSLSAAGSGRRLFSHSLSQPFHFRGLPFPALQNAGSPPHIGTRWAEPPKYKGRRPPGGLLTLLLDASLSMDSTDAFDGRSRAAHVDEILRATLSGLSQSAVGSNLLVSVLSFSNQVEVVTPHGDGVIFSPLRVWQQAASFNYLAAVPRGGTNIRLTLDRAADLIDGFRQSDVASDLAMSWKHATVVMLTDGEHYTEVSGRIETSKDILAHVFATLNRSKDVSFGFVGLGEEADHKSLLAWSSTATPQQIALAARKGVPLENNRLYVRVNTGNANLGAIVRSFVDLASSRAA